MNISKTKIAFYLLTFQKSKIPEYLLSIANNWVAQAVTEGTKDTIRAGLDTGNKVLSALSAYAWLCPEKWRVAYAATVQAFADLVAAASDLQLTVDEITTVGNSFKIAYADWCAD